MEYMKDGGNTPTNPELWSRAIAAAKAKYDVYPSAYANGYAAKWYKEHGGGWKKAEMGGTLCYECGGSYAYGGLYVMPFAEEGGIHLDPAKKGTFKAQATRMDMSVQEAASHILANKENYSPEMVKKAVFAHNFAKELGGYIAEDMPEEIESYGEGGGIPERYKNMGFTKVGVKKESTRPGKKWMVLAKKGDQYKVVHGGYDGMKDYTQHHNENRRDRFWDRMGGRDSAKAKDPFSPLYWHKRFGTWEEGGELPEMQDAGTTPDYESMIQAGDHTIDTTYKRQLNNLENNNWNRGLAVANSLTDPRSPIHMLPDKGFGSGLKALAGIASAGAGTILGYEKMFAKDKTERTLYNNETGEYGKREDVLKARWDKANPASSATTTPSTTTTSSMQDVKSAPPKSNMTPTGGSGMGAMEKQNYYNFDEPYPATYDDASAPVAPTTAPVTAPAVTNTAPTGSATQMVNLGKGTLKQDAEGNWIYGSDETGWSKSQDREMAENKWRAGSYNTTSSAPVTPATPLTIPAGMQNIINNVQVKRNGGNILPRYQWAGLNDGEQPEFKQWLIQNSMRPDVAAAYSDQNKLIEIWKSETGAAGPVKEPVGPVVDDKPQGPGAPAFQKDWTYTQRGDTAGFVAANNALIGLGMANNVLGQKNLQKQYDKRMMEIGNTDAMYNAVNPSNPYGNYTTNVGIGPNFALVRQTAAQDFSDANLARYGGTMRKQYREGGSYMVSDRELMEILANGGDVEFL